MKCCCCWRESFRSGGGNWAVRAKRLFDLRPATPIKEDSSALADATARRARLLFVDDEESIRQTMPRILEMNGFHVTVTGSVPEALAAIHAKKFDVLLADLNVGQPGDGFTIVSAMRRTQPAAVTLILTGYPAFDTALEAIRSQVDGYIVKPAEIDGLLKTIDSLLNSHQPHHAIVAKRVPRLLNEHCDEISNRWIQALKNSKITGTKVSDGDLNRDAASSVEWVLRHLQNGASQANALELAEARQHGARRKKQGYSLPHVIEECSLLRRELLQLVEQNLLAIEISYVVTDLAALNTLIDRMLTAAVEGYLGASTE